MCSALIFSTLTEDIERLVESGLTKSKFFISLLLRYKLSALKKYFLNPYNFIYKIGDDCNVVTEFPCVYGTPCAQNLHKMFCPTLNKHLVSWIIIQTMVDDFNVVTQFPFFLGHPVSQNAWFSNHDIFAIQCRGSLVFQTMSSVRLKNQRTYQFVAKT